MVQVLQDHGCEYENNIESIGIVSGSASDLDVGTANDFRWFTAEELEHMSEVAEIQ